MIDPKYKVRRFISEYSESSDELINEYELITFDLAKFQAEFGERNNSNPMFDCYVISESNVSFLRGYLLTEPRWNFDKNRYFVEAHGT